jgi:hypothetical protein
VSRHPRDTRQSQQSKGAPRRGSHPLGEGQGEGARGGASDPRGRAAGDAAAAAATAAAAAAAAAGAPAGGSRKGVVVGIITPYREQVFRIRALARAVLGADVANAALVVSSVDGFQGQEVDHVIFCAVRSPARDGGGGGGGAPGAPGAGGIGFLSDARRLNVAITRARVSLTLVCNAKHLAAADRHWRDFIIHAGRMGRAVLVRADGAGGAPLADLCPRLAASLAALRARGA